MIRVYEVRVVDEDGSQLGVMRTADALRLAQERGLDLVEVAPLASPPVARLLDFGQYKYELTKREKEAKRKQRSVTFKEVRLKPKIGVGDFDTKVRRAIEFLEDGDRVKISVQFRGRELTHPQIGRDLLDKFAEQIKEHGVVETASAARGQVDAHQRRLDPQAEGARTDSVGHGQGSCPTRGRSDRNDGRERKKRRTRRRRLRRQGPDPSRTTARRRLECETVPKMKSHKGTQKRIGVTGSGKAVRVKSWRGHHLELKSSRRTRRYDGKAIVTGESLDQIRRLLPYLGV